MDRIILARKGEACPATSHYGGESRFQERRVIELPAIALGGDIRSLRRSPNEDQGRPASGLTHRPAVQRRKFTFRVEPDRHEAFCEAANLLGISRQELLTRALDAYLAGLDDPHAAAGEAMRPAIHNRSEIPAPRAPQGLLLSAIR